MGDDACQNSKTQDNQDVCATITGHTNVGRSESALQEAVGNVGPITIGVNASPWSHYSGGVYDDPSCGAQLNHAVCAVGFDTNQGYWIVRNSWGGSWESRVTSRWSWARTCAGSLTTPHTPTCKFIKVL